MHIAIEGIIGVGKTTIGRLLATELGHSFIGEAADVHPFLEKFYGDPARYALETELNFLLIHYHQLAHRRSGDVVTDFTIGKDLVFARMNLCGQDLRCFQNLYDELSQRIPHPDVTIFLRLNPEECLRRIRLRSRPEEEGLQVTYLRKLEDAYLDNIEALGPAITILDVGSAESRESVLGRIMEQIRPIVG